MSNKVPQQQNKEIVNPKLTPVVKEQLKEFYESDICWTQEITKDRILHTNRDVTPEVVQHLISSMLAVLNESNKIHKKYWFYCDEWHDADCSFIQHDIGICNCNLEKNGKIINSLKEDK